jgi:hypothetical protein
MTGMRNHSHKTERGLEKLQEVELTAHVGQRPTTPSILLGDVSVVVSVVVAALLALSLPAYRFAS